MQNPLSGVVPLNFNGKNKLKVQIWYICWLLIFRLSPHYLNFIRVFLINIFGGNVSYTTKIKPSFFVSYPWNLSVGINCYIGDYVYIDSLTYVKIGNNVSLSNKVYITTGTHDYTKVSFDLITSEVNIGSFVWLSVNSTIMPGVTIGDGAIVGACSLVLCDIGTKNIYVGVPAKKIGMRSE